MSERLHCIKNNITERPICKSCGEFVKFFRSDGYYPPYCNKECFSATPKSVNNISKEQLEEAYKFDSIMGVAKKFNTSAHYIGKLLDKYGITRKTHQQASADANKLHLSGPKLTKKYSHSLLSNKEWLYEQRITNKLSKESIADLANCSTTIVNNYLDKFDIPKVRYNESEISTKAKLQNKELLESLYETNNMDKIAEIIGSTKATVSVAFKKLGIEAKDPNSYDRPFNHISIGHEEVVKFIKQHYNGQILINNRTIIGTEIDILLPEINYGIEYNGLYYHYEKPEQTKYSLKKDKTYHINKTNMCNEKGYQLFHLFEDQWQQKQDIVKSMILSKLQKNTKIFARKCIITTISKQQANLFFEQNHIQGKNNASICYALKYENKIVAAMSFNNPRFTDNYDWELVRFATILNTNVIGSFSKLLKAFQRDLDGLSIISYSDNTYSKGNVYEMNGFRFSHKNPPGYWYVSPCNKFRYPRTMFTKAQIKRKFGVTNDELTERELMKLLGFNVIWNCGTKVWVIDKKNKGLKKPFI